MLKLVPFNDSWVGHDKLDLKAIYRRPRWVEDAYGEMHREMTPEGLPAWDLTGPLSVKHHNKHRAKGFEYVTLADRESLHAAAAAGTIVEHGVRVDWRAYVQDPRTNGPWHYRKYVEGQAVADTAAAAQLASDVERFGPDAVEAIRRQTDPSFRVPDALKGHKRPVGRPRKLAEPEAVA